MARISTDILISGGGVAGLSAAAAFGSAGHRVICVDPTPPVTSDADPGADLRTTAFLQPSIPVLEAAGLWKAGIAALGPREVLKGLIVQTIDLAALVAVAHPAFEGAEPAAAGVMQQVAQGVQVGGNG